MRIYGHGPFKDRAVFSTGTDIRHFGGNGDGTLFYPGLPAKIGGHTEIPIDSIRLKLNTGRYAADAFAGRIVQNTWRWKSRPEAFLRVRRELDERDAQ